MVEQNSGKAHGDVAGVDVSVALPSSNVKDITSKFLLGNAGMEQVQFISECDGTHAWRGYRLRNSRRTSCPVIP